MSNLSQGIVGDLLKAFGRHNTPGLPLVIFTSSLLQLAGGLPQMCSSFHAGPDAGQSLAIFPASAVYVPLKSCLSLHLGKLKHDAYVRSQSTVSCKTQCPPYWAQWCTSRLCCGCRLFDCFVDGLHSDLAVCQKLHCVSRKDITQSCYHLCSQTLAHAVSLSGRVALSRLSIF